VLKAFLQSNLDYYERMAKLFPNEPVWKKAAKDTRKLLQKQKEAPTK